MKASGYMLQWSWLYFLMILMSMQALAQTTPVLLEPEGTPVAVPWFSGQSLSRVQRVRLDTALIDSNAPAEQVLPARLQLNLLSDVSFVVERIRAEALAGGRIVWHGRIVGDPLSSVTLLVRGQQLLAHVRHSAYTYEVRPGAVGGGHEVREIDPGAYPETPDDMVFGPAGNAPPVTGDEDGSVIDIMVVYTDAAVQDAGSVALLEDEIVLTVSETNQALLVSGVNFRYRLVHTAPVNSPQTTDLRTALYRLQDASDGIMDEVHPLRDEYRADLVSLVVAEESVSICGIAFASPRSADYAFSVVKRSCLSGYTLAHELGHNLGARHDWFEDDSFDPGTYTAYAKGHVNPAVRFRTIMSYDSRCQAEGFSCTQIGHFANPEVSIEGGATGVPIGTDTSCVEGNIDNPFCDSDVRRVFNDFAVTAANYRQSLAELASEVDIVGVEPSPSVVGETVQVAVRVSAVDSGETTIPGGRVEVSSGGGPTCESLLDEAGEGNCTLRFTSAGSYSLRARYTGNNDFAPSDSTPEPHAVLADPATTTTRIDSHEPEPSTPGQAVMVGYTVSAAEGTPTGTVTVSSGAGNPVCSGPLDGDGQGACSLRLERVGSYDLRARYGGDDNFQASVSAPESHTVAEPALATLTTIFADEPDPSLRDESVAVAVRVVALGGSGVPGGEVRVESDGAPSCRIAALAADGTGSCQLRFTEDGVFQITAYYAGNADFAPSVSDPEAHTVQSRQIPSTLVIFDEPDPSVVDEVVRVRFQVVSTPVVPTGTVTVNTVGGGPDCSGVLDGDGRGHCELVFGTPGDYLLEASYPGDDRVLGSTASEPHGVLPPPRSSTRTYLTAAPDPSGQGKWLAVGYQVVSEGEGVSSGQVVVSAADGGPECRGGLGAEGLGRCWLLFMQAGSYRLSAEYLGNDTYAPSVSAVEPHRVAPSELVPSHVAIINHYPDPSATTESVSVRMVVRSADTTVNIMPSGTVSVRAGNGASCRARLDGDGRGRCVLRIATPGEWSLSAHYESDGLFAGSVSPAMVHTVCDPDNPTASGIPACRDFPRGLLLRGSFE